MQEIVLGVDKESSGGAVAITAELAARLGAHVAVSSTFASWSGRRLAGILSRDKFAAAGIEANLVIADNRDGVANEITRTALESGCDLIVIPAGASDLAERWVLGTVDEEVRRRSGSGVLVAPPIDSTRTDRN